MPGRTREPVERACTLRQSWTDDFVGEGELLGELVGDLLGVLVGELEVLGEVLGVLDAVLGAVLGAVDEVLGEGLGAVLVAVGVALAVAVALLVAVALAVALAVAVAVALGVAVALAEAVALLVRLAVLAGLADVVSRWDGELMRTAELASSCTRAGATLAGRAWIADVAGCWAHTFTTAASLTASVAWVPASRTLTIPDETIDIPAKMLRADDLVRRVFMPASSPPWSCCP